MLSNLICATIGGRALLPVSSVVSPKSVLIADRHGFASSDDSSTHLGPPTLEPPVTT